MADMHLSLILSAKDRLSSVIRTSVQKSEQAFDNFQKKIENVSSKFNDIGKRSLVAGGALLATSGIMLKSAADFEKSLTNVSTLIDTSSESMSEMKKQVLEIGKRTPVDLGQLSTALYDIRSAGIAASEQFSVLEKSAQLGVAGLGTTAEATDLVTSSINAFKLKGEEQQKLYDNIFKTVKYGKTNISGLAQGFGSVAGTVAAAGIKIDDYLSSVAALTTTGQPAAQAHTQMKAAIAGLTRNTKEQQKVFKALNAKDFNDLIKKSGSVVNAFSGINRAVHGNKAEMIKLLGSIEAYNAVLSLTGNQNKAYTQTLVAMRSGSDAFSEGYQKQLHTINAQMQRGRNILQKIGIDLGTYLMPPFSKFLDLTESVLNKVDLLPEKTKRITALGTVVAGAGLVGFGGISLAVGGAIKSFGSFLSTYRTVSKFMYRHRFTEEVKAIRGIAAAFKSFATLGNLKLTLWDTKGVQNFLWSVQTATPVAFTAMKNSALNNLNAIKTGFAVLPANIAKSVGFIKGAIISAPLKVSVGFNALKASFLNLPSLIKSAVVAFRTLNVTLALNPVGLVVSAFALGAVLIIRYWKPITAFFRGLWTGLKEGLQPLKPAFDRLSNAIKPIYNGIASLLKPVLALFKPINSNGKAAESWGLKIGKTIGTVVVKVTKLIDKILTLNGLWKNAPWHKSGNASISPTSKTVTKPVDGSHESGLSYVPFDGYLAELHKGERVLTADENRVLRNYNTQSQTCNYVFSPVINGVNKDIKEIEAMIDRKQREFFNKIQTENRRKEVRKYA